MAECFHETNVSKSRKPRVCSWCGERIEVGKPYRGYSWREGNDYGRAEMHPECYDAFLELAATEHWLEWTPGDFSRGCACEHGACRCVNGRTTE